NASNEAQNTVEAFLADGASVTTTAGGDVTLTALDKPSLSAQSVGGALSVAASATGAGNITVGVATSSNSITDTVHATSDGASIDAAGAVSLSATVDVVKSSALAIAASVGVTIAPAGFSFAGGGTKITSTIKNDVLSSLGDADATAPDMVHAA